MPAWLRRLKTLLTRLLPNGCTSTLVLAAPRKGTGIALVRRFAAPNSRRLDLLTSGRLA